MSPFNSKIFGMQLTPRTAPTTHSGEVVGYLSGLLLGGSDDNDSAPAQYILKQLLCNDEFSISLYEATNSNDPLTRYNVVYITFKTEHFDEGKYKEFLAAFAGTLQLMQHRYYMVVDTFQMTMDNKPRLLGMIKLFTETNKAMTEYHRQRLLCTVVVIASPIVKAFINSVISMFYKPLRPLMFVTGFDEFRTFVTHNVGISDEIYAGMHDSAGVTV